METKVTRHFSKPLMKQNIKSNIVLIVAITVIMLLMSTVMNYAMSIMGSSTAKEDLTEYQTEFYTYLSAMAQYDTMSGANSPMQILLRQKIKLFMKPHFPC